MVSCYYALMFDYISWGKKSLYGLECFSGAVCPLAFIEGVFFFLNGTMGGGLHFTSCSIGERFCSEQDGTFAFELMGGLPLPCLCGPRAEPCTCGLDILYLCEDSH